MSSDKENLRKENTIRFIEAAQALIDEYGIEKVSIRKIAEKAGFHNSTIYLYFKDVDQLILLASLKHFNEYTKALARLSSKNWEANENFYFIWRFFIESMFKQPKIFYNFFFGKHGNDFGLIIKEYHDLFPEEAVSFTPAIQDMYYGKNIQERCLKLLMTIQNEDNKINEKNLRMINDIIVSCMKCTLEQKCQNPEADSDILARELMQMIEFVIEH